MLTLCAGLAQHAIARPLAVDDALHMEDFGRVALAAGDRIVYEWMPPYERAPNLRTLVGTEDHSALAKLYVSDAARPAKPQPLFEQAESGGYWIGALSPSGGKLAFYSLVEGELHAGVYDFETRDLRIFEFTPSYFRLAQKPAWLSENEVVYAAVPRGVPPSITEASDRIAWLNEQWRKAFGGTEPSATVAHSDPHGIHVSAPVPPGSLVRVDVRTGTTKQIAVGHFFNLVLSPTGRYLAALKEDARVQPLADAPAGGNGLGRKQLVVFDLKIESEQGASCTDCDVVLGSPRWTAKGDSIFLVARHFSEGGDRFRVLSYVPAAGVVQEVPTEPVRASCGTSGAHATAAGLAGGVAVFGSVPVSLSTISQSPCDLEPGARNDWWLLRPGRTPLNLTSQLTKVSARLVGLDIDALFILADGDVWRLDARGGRRNLTRDISEPLTSFGVGPAIPSPTREERFVGDTSPQLQVVLQSRTQLIMLDLRRGQSAVIGKPEPGAEPVAASHLARRAVFRSLTRHGSRLILGTNGAEPRTLHEINEHLREVSEARQVRIKYQVIGGMNLSSCMLLPPGWTPTKRYPLVVDVYPDAIGDCYSTDLATLNAYNLQLLAAQGYVVLFASTPRELLRNSEGPAPEIAPVVLAAVDQAVAEGYADPSKVALYGFSQGNLLALDLLTETTRFRTAVAIWGISNPVSHYGTAPLATRIGHDGFVAGNAARYESERSSNWFGARPWEDPGRYVRNSPVLNADKIRTPILIMHSDFDIFPLGQSEEIFSALYRLRREATYVTYWGEGHGVSSPANIRDMWQRIFSWLDVQLSGEASSR